MFSSSFSSGTYDQVVKLWWRWKLNITLFKNFHSTLDLALITLGLMWRSTRVWFLGGRMLPTALPELGGGSGKHLFKVRWLFKSHINFLEMKMILNTILWKARDVSKINKRWLHLEDSMVCLFILSKGRTSSHLLQPLVNKIGAVQMAMGATLLHAHVRSEENPTDEASRA